MIVDTSAIAAIVFREPGFDRLVDLLAASTTSGIGTPTLAEAGIVLSARLDLDAGPLLARFLQEFDVTTVPFGAEHWREGVEAYRRFGKGRHPASLNFGDCLTYATAMLAAQPLLCTGRDFARTDLPLVAS